MSLATFVNSSASCLDKPKLACILLWELPTLLAESTACFPNSVSLSPMSLKTSEASIKLFISILLPISSKLVVSTFLAACPNSSNSRSASLSFASICIASVDVAPNSDCVASNCRLRISIVFSAFSDC